MQGADRVNDELEVGFDQTFERRWSRVERTGYGVMALFIAAGLAGLFGRGPFSHRTRHSGVSGLTVDFEPVARSQCDTQVTFHIDNPTDAPTRTLFLGTNLVEPMGLHQVQPEPARTQTTKDGLIFTLAIPPHTQGALVRVMLMPSTIGPQQMIARLDDQPPLRWNQFVMP